MKKLSLNVRLNKSGQPRKGEIERVKANIKANFDKVKKEDLSAQPKAIQSYFNQVASGKKRGELNKNKLRDAKGQFLSKPAAKALIQRTEQFILDKNLQSKYENAKEFLDENPTEKNMLLNLAVNDIITLTDRTDNIFNRLDRNDFQNITLVDQNGEKLEGLTKQQAEFFIRENLRELFRVFKGDKFQSWHRYTISNAGQNIEINYFNMESLEGESPETIQEILSEQEESGNFGAYGSPTNKGKKNETNKSEKPNGKTTTKQPNRVSKKK
jgi:hypothetical protein